MIKIETNKGGECIRIKQEHFIFPNVIKWLPSRVRFGESDVCM